MQKILAGSLLAPVAATLLIVISTGNVIAALVVTPFLYLLTLVVGSPLFLICRRLHLLNWWHAAISGTAMGVGLAWPMVMTGGNPYHFEMYGVAEFFLYTAMGIVVAMAFWFIAIYGNGAFPYVSSRLPWSPLVATAILVALTAYLNLAVHTSDLRGQITAMLPPDGPRPMARLRLDSGQEVVARLRCYSAYRIGDAVNVTRRGPSLLLPERYWAGDLVADPKGPVLKSPPADMQKCLKEWRGES